MQIRSRSIMAALLAPVLLVAQSRDGGVLRIVVLEGDGALNDIRKREGRSPVVEVRDEQGRGPVAGATVTFRLPDSGPGATFSGGGRNCEATTGADGRAAAAPLRPNGVEGRYAIRIRASAEGKTGSAEITQANTRAGGSTLKTGGEGGSKKRLLLLALGGGVTVVSLVLRRGGSSSSSSTPATPTSISVGGVTVGGPR
jgi:hypothetical protein